MRVRNVSRRSLLATLAATLGLVLVAIAAFGLLTRDDRSDAGASHAEPTHRIEFDIRPEPAARPTTTTTTTAPPVTSAPKPIPLPVSVSIPSVGIGSPLIPLGLNPDNTLEVPKDFAVAGWYTGRPVPGELGPSIIAGHVDSKRGPAVFYHLGDVQPGASVDVARSDGSVARFTVVAKEEHDKDAFPTDHVYGPTDSPELRLITCGGTFDRSIGHYNDNIIVFAELAAIV
jgi:sortase (surface protein transpeptidase)